MKNLNDSIDICRQQRLVTSMFRAPIDFDFNSIGKCFIREINAMNLPLISIQKNGELKRRRKHLKMKMILGNNPYCVIEMNNYQRQTTPVLCDTLNLQWNVSFRFFIGDIKQDFIKFSIYNRSKYTTDRMIS